VTVALSVYLQSSQMQISMMPLSRASQTIPDLNMFCSGMRNRISCNCYRSL